MQLELFVDAKIAGLCLVKAKLRESEDFHGEVMMERLISSWEWIKEIHAQSRPPVKSDKVVSMNKNCVLTPLSVITRLVRNYRALVAELCEIFVPDNGLCRSDIRYLAISEIESSYHWLDSLKRGLLADIKNHSRKTLTHTYTGPDARH